MAYLITLHNTNQSWNEHPQFPMMAEATKKNIVNKLLPHIPPVNIMKHPINA